MKRANQTYESKINYLRKQGAKIGSTTKLNCCVEAFGTEPYLIEVGENCLLTSGIHLFTHDGEKTVLDNLNYFEGEQMDKIAPIKIGNNVYMGIGACVLPGITIGNNVIIGAGAVVTKDIPSNSVAAGVPAKVISNIDDYCENSKRKNILYPTMNLTPKQKKEYLKRVFDIN